MKETLEMTPENIEKVVRRMRDIVYGKPISDHEWQNAREHWLKDIPWLMKECNKLDVRVIEI